MAEYKLDELKLIDFDIDDKKNYVLFIRHGYSLANIFEGKLTHQLFRNKYAPDPNLTKIGYEKAKDLGKQLSRFFNSILYHAFQ